VFSLSPYEQRSAGIILLLGMLGRTKNVFGLGGYDFGAASGIVTGFGKQTYFVGCLFMQWMGSGMGFLEGIKTEF